MLNNLNHAQIERLVVLIEECAEVQHIACKILRHGFDAAHPDGGPCNGELLNNELGDLRGIMDLMLYRGDINPSIVDYATNSTKRKYMTSNFLVS